MSVTFAFHDVALSSSDSFFTEWFINFQGREGNSLLGGFRGEGRGRVSFRLKDNLRALFVLKILFFYAVTVHYYFKIISIIISIFSYYFCKKFFSPIITRSKKFRINLRY